MVYGDGGWASARVRLDANSGPPGAGITAHTENRQDGWTYGGGIAYMIDPHVVLGVQYDFLKFDGERHSALTNTGGPFVFDSSDIELQTVTARLSIKLQ